jgi:hypothetical protein
MRKSTKTCDLQVTLLTGEHLRGRFHVEAATSSMIRPSDAVRQEATGWLLLTDVTDDGHTPAKDSVVLVNRAAIATVQLISTGWQT